MFTRGPTKVKYVCVSTKSKSWKTKKDVTSQQNEVKRVVNEGEKARAEEQELKNLKKGQEASQDQGVGSSFCLYTAAPLPPPDRGCK